MPHTTKCSEMIHTWNKMWTAVQRKKKASGEPGSLNEQPGTYDEFWCYTNRAEEKNRTEKVSESEQTASREDMTSLLLYLTNGPDLIKP